MRLEYRPAERAAATNSARSTRCNGSPPERPTCKTPSSAASQKTRFHSLVESSFDAEESSTGLEQEGQCSGQRWVRSASRLDSLGGVSLMASGCRRLSVPAD